MRRGFTLVETLLSFTILALTLVLILNLFPTGMAALKSAEQRYRAGAMASSLLEAQVARPFESLLPGSSVELARGVYDQVEYRPRVEIFDPQGDPLTLKGVRVSVRWTVHDEERVEVRELYLHHLHYQR